jgi:prepilin signal peptidase PulO-like enzyme (type II secretory pathway)
MELGVGALTALTAWAAFAMPALWSPAIALSGAPWLAPAAAALALTVLVWLLLAASLIDIEHLIIPDELSKGFQLFAIPLAFLTSAGLAWGWDPSGWLGRRDVLGMVTPTPGKAAIILGAILAVGLGGILACLPLARRIYGRWAAAGQAWSEDDHRAFRLGAWWFTATTLLWSLPVFALLWWRPAGADGFPWWVFATVIPIQSLLGALAGWWLPYLVGLLGTVAFRRSAMGFGDVKLFAAIGAFLGPIGVAMAFALATVLGTAIGLPLRLLGGGREMPFGPSLALGAAIALPLAPWLGARLVAPLFG